MLGFHARAICSSQDHRYLLKKRKQQTLVLEAASNSTNTGHDDHVYRAFSLHLMSRQSPYMHVCVRGRFIACWLLKDKRQTAITAVFASLYSKRSDLRACANRKKPAVAFRLPLSNMQAMPPCPSVEAPSGASLRHVACSTYAGRGVRF